jgi:hypothetical protein
MRPLPKARVLGHAPRHAVAHETGGRGTTGGDAHPAADQHRAQEELPVLEQLAPGLPHHLEVDLGALALQGQTLFHREQDLADAEEADHGDQEVKALEQFGHAKGHAQACR